MSNEMKGVKMIGQRLWMFGKDNHIKVMEVIGRITAHAHF